MWKCDKNNQIWYDKKMYILQKKNKKNQGSEMTPEKEHVNSRQNYSVQMLSELSTCYSSSFNNKQYYFGLQLR